MYRNAQVSAEIARLTANRCKKLDVSADEVTKRLRQLALFDIRKLITRMAPSNASWTSTTTPPRLGRHIPVYFMDQIEMEVTVNLAEVIAAARRRVAEAADEETAVALAAMDIEEAQVRSQEILGPEALCYPRANLHLHCT